MTTMRQDASQINRPQLVYKHPAGGPAPAWANLVGTFFGIGRLKPGPGTWASLVTTLLWWGAMHFAHPRHSWLIAIIVTAVVTLIGIPAATRVAMASGIKDPSFVVIDEVAGQMLALIAAPITWKALLAGFILFRLFDIVKPFPIRRLEALPGGTGIVVDDLGAGVYALIVLQLILRSGILR